jgi:hypothetical protein
MYLHVWKILSVALPRFTDAGLDSFFEKSRTTLSNVFFSISGQVNVRFAEEGCAAGKGNR